MENGMIDFTATDFEAANHAGHVMSQVKIQLERAC
jgi:hypothetical protein